MEEVMYHCAVCDSIYGNITWIPKGRKSHYLLFGKPHTHIVNTFMLAQAYGLPEKTIPTLMTSSSIPYEGLKDNVQYKNKSYKTSNL